MSALDRYPTEVLSDHDDDGTMPENVEELRQAVVGHRIVAATKGRAKILVNRWGGGDRLEDVTGLIIELDDGTKVVLEDTSDCCAHTTLESFLLNPGSVDHIITGVGTTDEYESWHIFADMGDVLKLKVGWSCGNPFYYGYGFDVHVSRIVDGEVPPESKAIER